jgi:hypothetical protein
MAATLRSDAGHAPRGPNLDLCRWTRPDGCKLILKASGRLSVWLPRVRKWWTLRADCTFPEAAEVARERGYTRKVGGPLGTAKGKNPDRALLPCADEPRVVLTSAPLAPAGNSRPAAEHEAAIRAHARRVARRDRPCGSRCFGCGKPPRKSSGRGLTGIGWRTRLVKAGQAIREVVCPDCFRRWGWW